jgi:DNA primase large subunit
MQALDWSRENIPADSESKKTEYKPIQIADRSEKNFPPCVKKILLGVQDGKKRALFALINFFRSIGTEKDELEKILYSWNEQKNQPPLQKGYISSQISWALKRKPIMPPNCKEFYQGISVCFPDELCKLIKNPVNYVVKKNFQPNKYRNRRLARS